MSAVEKKTLGYYLLYGSSYVLALLPFSVLFLFSDLLYYIVYYVVKYRRKVVWKNLSNAFPQKTHAELKSIEKQFYHFLCDYYFETIKLLHISDEEAKKRMKFKNPELIDRLTQDGKSCVLSLGHYGNWEYVPSIGYYLRDELKQEQVYKKLSSKVFDEFFLKLRSRFRPHSVEMNQVYRTLIRYRQAQNSVVIGFLSDQSPRLQSEEYWTTFLNQDTKTITGMERIARQFGYSVVFLDLVPVKRGYFEGTFRLVTTDASQEEPFAVTEKYFRLLEQTIQRNPPFYLWSHNRWKHTRK